MTLAFAPIMSIPSIYPTSPPKLPITFDSQAMESPHPYWADHDHSDEHLNLMFTTFPLTLEPPHPYRADHDHSDEHLDLMCTTVRQQSSLSPPRSVTRDSGYFSPSESRSHARGKLRTITLTPTHPVTFPLFAEEEDQTLLACRAEERLWSSAWSASSENLVSISDLESEEKCLIGKSRPSGGNMFTRGLRRACECIGAAVVATGKKVRSTGSGDEKELWSWGLGWRGGRFERDEWKCGSRKVERACEGNEEDQADAVV
ncbi:hypothetical protein HO173_012220 [Letharia columbiana]|uniref:Uncharacterized protein n=1 Tax=Letharia columbiana TaxID=112416 RepID=A0A8H6CQU3_9LECA|nr:uncharacterized protein HO173_012220 [Letharia columbiana]KAF6227581.1 hypothetical protein HO173_012220 [Letharia columbiana]